MTINLHTGESYAPRREDYITKKAGTYRDPDVDTPMWHAFLTRITAGDVDLQDYLQRVAGYCLTGDTREHVLFFLYGTGANGKTVFLNTLAGIWGDYSAAVPTEVLMESQTDRHPTELARLRGVRLAIASETEQGRRWAESRIKSLTGGEPIAARFMRQDFFEYAPQFKLMIAGNHKPSLRGVDEAIRRRMHLVPFTITIPPEERDPDLGEKLKAEWPGILAWAVDGGLEWQRIGLAPPKAVRTATDAYLAAEDSFNLWREECTTPDPNARELLAELFASWRAWADRAGEPAGSQKRFAQVLEERGFTRQRQGGTGKTEYLGARLNRRDYTDDPRYGG